MSCGTSELCYKLNNKIKRACFTFRPDGPVFREMYWAEVNLVSTGWCVLQNAECRTGYMVSGICEAKSDSRSLARLLAQKLIRIGFYWLFFKFINQKITKSSETNLVYLDLFDSESEMIVTWFSPSWLSSPLSLELELSWRHIDRKWFCCDCGLPD